MFLYIWRSIDDGPAFSTPCDFGPSFSSHTFSVFAFSVAPTSTRSRSLNPQPIDSSHTDLCNTTWSVWNMVLYHFAVYVIIRRLQRRFPTVDNLFRCEDTRVRQSCPKSHQIFSRFCAANIFNKGERNLNFGTSFSNYTSSDVRGTQRPTASSLAFGCCVSRVCCVLASVEYVA